MATARRKPETLQSDSDPHFSGMTDDLPPGIEPRQPQHYPLQEYGAQLDPRTDAELAKEMQAEDQLSRLVDELGDEGGSVSVTIRRMNPKSNEWEHLRSVEAHEFSNVGITEYIASEFGGGKYECMIYTPPPNKRLHARPKIRIADDVRPKPQQPTGAPVSDIARLAETMQQGFMQLGALLAKKEDGDPEERLIRKLALYRELLGGGEKRDSGAKFEDLRSMLEFVKELQPREGEPGLADTLMRFADKFGPQIGMVIENATKQMQVAPTGGQNPQRPVMLPGTQAAGVQPLQPAAPASAPLSEEQMFELTMLKYQLNLLLGYAQKGVPVESVAASLIDKVPPEMLDKWANDPKLVDQLVAIDKRIEPHRAYFEAVREKILELAFEPETDAENGEENEAA